MLNKLARNVSESVANQLQERMTTKFEWHAFSCDLNHEFAVKILVDVHIGHVMTVYKDLRCPLCESARLSKQPNL